MIVDKLEKLTSTIFDVIDITITSDGRYHISITEEQILVKLQLEPFIELMDKNGYTFVDIKINNNIFGDTRFILQVEDK